MKRECLVQGISIFVTFCHIEAFEGIADVYFKYNSNSNIFLYVAMSSPGGGGGALRYRGGAHLRYVFRGRRGLFCMYGGQNPLTIHEIYAALTPSDCRSDWASEFAAATCCR